MLKTKIIATASYHPQRPLTNGDLEKLVSTSDQWIWERTGIRERRISSPEGGEWPSDLASRAAKKALGDIDMAPNQIDCIICATMTPDFKTPSTACLVQKKLGITNNCMAFDLNAACSGFVYAFNTATAYIRAGFFRNILVIGTDCMSSVMDYQDRNCSVIFGDGAGVAILSGQETGDSDILATSMKADGLHGFYITIKNGGSAHPLNEDNIADREHFLKMEGQKTFKSAVKAMGESALSTVTMAGLEISDIHWMVPHQANIRILEATARKVGISMEKVVVNIEHFGNTTGATVPTCFDQAVRDGRIKRGNVILFTSFGAGLSWGSTVFRY